jgi:hypothetical protein
MKSKIIFWIVNITSNRIFECEKLNKNEYLVNEVYDLEFNILHLSIYIGLYKYNRIGKNYNINIMYNFDSKILNSIKEIQDYILLEKL